MHSTAVQLTDCKPNFTICKHPPMAPSRRSPAPPTHGRLWADERRQSLVDAAAEVLAAEGPDAVRVPEVASQAGVTRPVVYKHFANRQALLIGVLEDFSDELDERYRTVLADARGLDATLAGILAATCDTIAEKGPGAWRLLGSTGPDPEVEEVARQVRDRMLEPWLERVSRMTGVEGATALAIAHMTSAVTRGVVDLWIEGRLTCEQASELAMRGMRGLVREFSAKRR